MWAGTTAADRGQVTVWLGVRRDKPGIVLGAVCGWEGVLCTRWRWHVPGGDGGVRKACRLRRLGVRLRDGRLVLGCGRRRVEATRRLCVHGPAPTLQKQPRTRKHANTRVSMAQPRPPGVSGRRTVRLHARAGTGVTHHHMLDQGDPSVPERPCAVAPPLAILPRQLVQRQHLRRGVGHVGTREAERDGRLHVLGAEQAPLPVRPVGVLAHGSDDRRVAQHLVHVVVPAHIVGRNAVLRDATIRTAREGCAARPSAAHPAHHGTCQRSGMQCSGGGGDAYVAVSVQ